MSEPVITPVIVATTQVATKAPAEISLAGEAMLWFGVAIIAFLVYIFIKAQWSRKNPIDLNFLMIDQLTGNVTQGRFWGLIGGAAATFVFVFLAVSGHFDATFASAYILACFGLKVAGDVTSKPDPGASSTTTTTSTVHAAAPAVDPLIAASAVSGVETLNPSIKQSDVGKNVALVPPRKRSTTKGSK